MQQPLNTYADVIDLGMEAQSERLHRLECRAAEILDDPDLLDEAEGQYFYIDSSNAKAREKFKALKQRMATARGCEWEVLRNEYQSWQAAVALSYAKWEETQGEEA